MADEVQLDQGFKISSFLPFCSTYCRSHSALFNVKQVTRATDLGLLSITQRFYLRISSWYSGGAGLFSLSEGSYFHYGFFLSLSGTLK
jgi:hypothetical protein